MRSIDFAVLDKSDLSRIDPDPSPRTLSLPVRSANVPTFLVKNVGASAWGLAIHKVARLLAVSANSQRVTIFVPALGRSEITDTLSREDDGEALAAIDIAPTMSKTKPKYKHVENKSKDRLIDFEIVLNGHGTNIPNIAFCNTNLDEEGQYLASIDIDDCLFVWDIWRRAEVVGTSSSGLRCL